MLSHVPRSPFPVPRSQAGYTLLEVMLAFGLLAVGLGLLLSILSNGVHAIAHASDSTRASLYAESLLDGLGGDGRIRPGHSQGAFENGAYRWTIDIDAAQVPTAQQTPGIAAPQGGPSDNQLFHVVLAMQWKGGGSMRVETLRAYTAPQEIAQ